MRKTDGCVNCGEVREIAAHGLCFACYRRKERASERPTSGVDRHNPGVRQEHKKLFRGFTSVMVGLSDLSVATADVLTIRRTIEPYLAPIAKYLALSPEENQVEVNGEQCLENQFTVHSNHKASRVVTD
jgi:hypothetical protein